MARRVAAAGLVLLAAAAALRPDHTEGRSGVVVAMHDLTPGDELTADDVGLESRSAPDIPEGSAFDLGSVVGATLAGPARRGEILTDVRLLGRRLAQSTAGPDARIVPVHPADAALIELVRPGDVVDVVAAAEGTAQTSPRVVATDAIVVSVSARPRIQGSSSDRVVLVALPATSATAVAGAALTQTVTFTLH